METKPYRIQSPEDIAKDYGGNKQKIAEAMQMGIVDPTAGVLAGMFIDRMRSAQMQEQVPQSTVAQQVMGGAPVAAPLAQAGGLGATAPAMPPMAPQGGAPMGPPPMPEEAPMGMAAGGEFDPPYMAGGGLSELPIPDTMFDENRNGGYSGGGIVAFASAGEARARFPQPGEYGSFIEELAVQTFPGLQVTSRQRSAAKNAQVGGVPGSFHKTGDARDFTPPEGMSMKEFARALKAKFGSNFDVIDEGDHVHVEPGPKAGARMSIPERKVGTSQGQAESLEDFVSLAQRYTAPSEEELAVEDKIRKRYEELGSDEYYEKQRKASMWEALATMGFNMASSKAPGLLQAIGEAAAATLPGAKADKKERKELRDRALDGLMALGARNRERANEALKVGVDLYKSGAELKQAEELMKYRYAELGARADIAAKDRAATLAAALARRDNPTQFETIIGAIKEANPGMSRLQAIDYAKKKGYFGASQTGMALPGADGAGAEMDTSGMSIIGSRPVQ